MGASRCSCRVSCGTYVRVSFFVAFSPLNFRRVIAMHFAVVQRHDENSEGLPRRLICKMVQKAAGGPTTLTQATNSWDKTIHKFGRDEGLLTGYVAAQAGTSKHTQAGNEDLQRKWHLTVTEVIELVRARAKEILKDDALVEKVMP